MKENATNIQLIEGTFSPNAAAKVLFSLISNKIKYYNLELFSAKERSEGDLNHSQNKDNYFKEALKNLEQSIAFTKANNLIFDIVGTIEINFIKKT
jgi:hypothetical protein